VCNEKRSWPYVAPFATLMLFLGLGGILPGGATWGYPLRTVAACAVLLVCSRHLIRLRPSHAPLSVLMGVAVFAVWIGPDLLWPAYRHHWLFLNALLGGAGTGAPRAGWWFLAFRVGGSVLLVPIVEELFWRAWLMRWLVSHKFYELPLGYYAAQAFWISALLFASEHGIYWDVGLAAGLALNWWMVRTKSLADCILTHAVANACLAAYVLLAGRWEYWL
jgi:CAAX prenyl protease-like protein